MKRSGALLGNWKLLPALLPLLALSAQGTWAQDPVSTDSVSADSAAVDGTPGSTLVPLPAVFYMTETGLGFGLVVNYYYYMSGAASGEGAERMQPSTIMPFALYTTKKQVIAGVGVDLYPAGGRYRIVGEAGYIKFPTTFWGIGNDAPDEAEEDYTPRSVNIFVEGQRQLFPGWYFGLLGKAAYRALSVVQDSGLLDLGLVPGAEDGRVIGLGASVARDTRSSTVYPRSGSYHQLRGTVNSGFFGSNHDYGLVELDLRKYVSAFGGHVLAFRALGQAVMGTAPFDLLPQLGGDALQRGYFGGRFRDKDLVAFQAEYRLPVWWRFGAVGFASAGQVAPRLGDFEFDRFKPAAGLGLRILLSPEEGLNIRADYGWGFDRKSTGFYLSIGEAF